MNRKQDMLEYERESHELAENTYEDQSQYQDEETPFVGIVLFVLIIFGAVYFYF